MTVTKQSSGPSAPPTFTYLETLRIRRMLRLAEGEMGKAIRLESPTRAEMAYLFSRVPSWQRERSPATVLSLLGELRRDEWSEHNGEFMTLYVDETKAQWLINGQQRVEARLRFVDEEEGALPSILNIYLTKDKNAFHKTDIGRVRNERELAKMRGHIPLSGGVRSAIQYEANDFRPLTGKNPDARVSVTYQEPGIVEFVRRMPLSGGDSKGWNALCGVYAAAIRASRFYSYEDVLTFFSALIRNEQTINEKKVEVLVAAEIALKSFTREGGSGKVMAATVAMRAFLAWIEGRRIGKKDFSPPDGKKEWPASMERPLPIEKAHRRQKKAA